MISIAMLFAIMMIPALAFLAMSIIVSWLEADPEMTEQSLNCHSGQLTNLNYKLEVDI